MDEIYVCEGQATKAIEERLREGVPSAFRSSCALEDLDSEGYRVSSFDGQAAEHGGMVLAGVHSSESAEFRHLLSVRTGTDAELSLAGVRSSRERRGTDQWDEQSEQASFSTRPK